MSLTLSKTLRQCRSSIARSCSSTAVRPVCLVSAQRTKTKLNLTRVPEINDIHVFLLQDVAGLGKKGEIVLADRKKVRLYLVPLKKAYYVPRVDGKPILPDGWKPKEVEEVLETILPAFSVIDPERAGASFGSFSHAAPTAHATPQSDTGPAPALVDLKTALETLPVLELHRVRVSDDSDRIYGSVTAEDIAGELKNRWNVIVDKANIHVAGGRFKEVGVKQVVVTISDTESVTLSISIKDFGEGGASAPATQS